VESRGVQSFLTDEVAWLEAGDLLQSEVMYFEGNQNKILANYFRNSTVLHSNRRLLWDSSESKKLSIDPQLRLIKSKSNFYYHFIVSIRVILI